MQEIIDRLLQAIESGKSRRQIAAEADLSEYTIRKILSGGSVTNETLARLADNYFKIPREDMLRMAGHLPPKDFNEQLHDFLLHELNRVMGRLSPENLKRVTEYAQRLIEEQSCDQD